MKATSSGRVKEEEGFLCESSVTRESPGRPGAEVRGHCRPWARSESGVKVKIQPGVREGSVQSGWQMGKTGQSHTPLGFIPRSGHSLWSH